MTSQCHLRWLLLALTVIACSGLFQMILTAPAHPLQAYPPPGAPTAPNPYPPPGTPTVGPTPPLAPQTLLNPAAYFPLALRQWALPISQKGIAWAFPNARPADFPPFHASWYHNWGPNPSDPIASFVEFVPFSWCDPQPAIDALPPDYAGYLLFQNEPELQGQCGTLAGPELTAIPTPDQWNRRVDHAAERYITLRAAFPNAKLIGPNLAYSNPDPERMMSRFVADWREKVHDLDNSYPVVAGYALHFYTDTNNAKAQLTDFCARMAEWGETDKEIWVTEFGFGNEWGIDKADVKTAVHALADLFARGTGLPPGCRVARYAYYTTRQRLPVLLPGTPTPPVGPTRTTWEIAYTDLYCRHFTTLTWTGEAYRDFGMVTPTPSGPVPTGTRPTIYDYCPRGPSTPTPTPTPTRTPTPLPAATPTPLLCLNARRCPTPTNG